jgi:hypothetical protein
LTNAWSASYRTSVSLSTALDLTAPNLDASVLANVAGTLVSPSLSSALREKEEARGGRVSRGRVDAFSDDETRARRMGRLLAPPIEKNRRAPFVSDGRFSSQRGRGFKNREAGGDWAPV